MKSLSLVTAFLLVCIVALSQVYAVPIEPTEEAEGVTPPVRVEQPQIIPEAGQPQACAPTMDIEQAHRNLIMAVCEQMQPGFMQNMMQPGTVRTVVQPGQGLGRRDLGNEVDPAQFPPFPPFPPPPTFPPFPPFPPGGRASAEQVHSAQFPPFPPFPPPPTFPPFPPFPPSTGGGGRN